MNAATAFQSTSFIQLIARFLVTILMLYLISRYFIYWHDWPTLSTVMHWLTGAETDIKDTQKTNGLILLITYIMTFIAVAFITLKTPKTSLLSDADRFKRWAYYLIRVAFWSVFLIGIADTVISFLRVEDLLAPLVGQDINDVLGLATKRGFYVHYPLIVLSMIIAWFSRSLGFMWLAFLVVLAEFTIVITRFVFSYEQAFMGDLVRFWYAALFLFASSYTLIEGGHVRVDVLYTRMKDRNRAWVNALGSLFLGLPVCWAILHYGVGTRQSSLIAPIINFEVSQSGYGLYVKYLMGGYLIIYAVSMALTFISYSLSSFAYLYHEPNAKTPMGGEH